MDQPVLDDDPRIVATTLDRLRLALPLQVTGITVGLAISPWCDLPLKPTILTINALVLAVALAMGVALRRGAITGRHIHWAAAVVWLLAPATTMTSLVATGKHVLVFPLMIEMAFAGIMQPSLRHLLGSTGIVLVGYLAVELQHGDDETAMRLASLTGLAVTTWLVGRATRRALDFAIRRDDQLVATAVLLQRELEERKRSDAERERLRHQFVHAQRMEAVGTLAAGLAHDMNNILAGILGISEIAAEDATDERARVDFSAISREAVRAAELTRGLLAFSHRGQYRRTQVRLEGIVDEVEPLLSRMFANHITLERRGGADVLVDVDAAQVSQAIVNLCINGADAMSGRGTLTLTTGIATLDAAGAARHQVPEGSYAVLSVRDSGRGMDDETKLRIFEPFFTTKEVGKGTGLGLAMVWGTIRGHGGNVEVESAAGAGATFSIYLPIAASAVTALTKPLRATTQPSRVSPRLALVVDDEPLVRAITTRILRQMGLSVVGAGDGAEALEVFAVRRDEISVVILDMSMPVMNGADCFRALRRESNVPIVIASGFANEVETQNLLSQGHTVFLEKPFGVDQLRGHIERLLDRLGELRGSHGCRTE
jgi:signal transduction histidine kinase/ActR/RegA family two-component response regulator